MVESQREEQFNCCRLGIITFMSCYSTDVILCSHLASADMIICSYLILIILKYYKYNLAFQNTSFTLPISCVLYSVNMACWFKLIVHIDLHFGRSVMQLNYWYASYHWETYQLCCWYKYLFILHNIFPLFLNFILFPALPHLYVNFLSFFRLFWWNFSCQ